MAQDWSNLTQEEKFNIMRDYVRRGFNNLDDIQNDFNAKQFEEYEKKADPEKAYKTNPSLQAIRELFRDWYSDGE